MYQKQQAKENNRTNDKPISLQQFTGNQNIMQNPQQGSSNGSEVNIFEDARLLKLVDVLINGRLTEITPVIDFNLKKDIHIGS